MTGKATIIVLPLAFPDWESNAGGVHVCRGLGSLLEGRLRLIPHSAVHLQHLVAAPDKSGGDARYVMRTTMWTMEEALGMPMPQGTEPTHFLQGCLSLKSEARLTIEIIDANAAYCCFREELRTSREEFPAKLFPLLGRVATAICPDLTNGQRALIGRCPTASPDAFQSYLIGLSQRVEREAGIREKRSVSKSFEPFQKALEADPRFVEPCIAIDMLGQDCFRNRRNMGTARRALERASEIAPEFSGFDRTLGIHYFDKGHFTEARERLERYLEKTTGRESGAPAVYVRLAALYHEYEGVRRARALLAEAMTFHPRNIDVQESFGICLAECGETSQAEACWRRVLDENPIRSTSLSNIGMLRWKDGDHERARILLERSVEAPDVSSTAYSRFVEFLIEREDFVRADEVATEWVERFSDNWRNWLQLAHIRRRIGQRSAAEYCLDQAERKADGKDHDGEIEVARFAIDHSSDYQLFLQALHVSEGAEEALQLGGKSAEEQTRGPLDSAARILRHLADQHPGLPFLWRALAQNLAVMKQYESAASVQKRFVELSPTNAMAHNTLGILLLKSGRRKLAIESFEYSVCLSPKTAAFRSNLVSALIDAHRLEEARQQLDHLAKTPHDPETVEKLRIRLEQAEHGTNDELPASGWMRRLLGLLHRDR